MGRVRESLRSMFSFSTLRFGARDPGNNKEHDMVPIEDAEAALLPLPGETVDCPKCKGNCSHLVVVGCEQFEIECFTCNGMGAVIVSGSEGDLESDDGQS